MIVSRMIITLYDIIFIAWLIDAILMYQITTHGTFLYVAFNMITISYFILFSRARSMESWLAKGVYLLVYCCIDHNTEYIHIFVGLCIFFIGFGGAVIQSDEVVRLLINVFHMFKGFL